jgi:hypothetical protein
MGAGGSPRLVRLKPGGSTPGGILGALGPVRKTRSQSLTIPALDDCESAASKLTVSGR